MEQCCIACALVAPLLKRMLAHRVKKLLQDNLPLLIEINDVTGKNLIGIKNNDFIKSAIYLFESTV